jgi:nucleotide-binding universal stress UspA family protein
MTCERWIVVGTDFSDGAHDALERAVRMAEDSGANVALVHAYEEPPAAVLSDDPTHRLMGYLAEEIATSDAARHGVHVEPLVRRGPPWEKILNAATEYGAEMIVVGSTGQRGTTPGVPLGSVAARVLALSTRCVLVARPWALTKQS